MQTLIDKNEALRKEIKELKGKIKDIQSAPFIPQPKPKKQKKGKKGKKNKDNRKSMFGTLIDTTSKAFKLNLFVSIYVLMSLFCQRLKMFV